MRLPRRTPLLPILIVAIALNLAFAGTVSVVEDFSTTTFRDNTATTARWNTSTQQLELWPHVFSEIGSATVPTPTAVTVRDFEAFVLANGSEMRIYDVSDPTAPSLTNTVPGLSGCYAIDVVGDYAYIADGSNGLVTIDLNTMSIVGATGAASSMVDVEVVGTVAYVTYGSSFLIIDVSTPGLANVVGSYYTGNSVSGLDVEGNYCYIADGGGGLTIVDVSNSAFPVAAGNVSTGGTANDVVVDGDVAYVACTSSGLAAVDVSNPAFPLLLDNLSGVDGYSIAVAGDIAYLGRDTDVLITDISDPSNLSPYNVAGSGPVYGVATDGEYAYSVDSDGTTFFILEALEPTPLAETATIDPGQCIEVVLEGNVLYSTGADFHCFDVSGPTAPALLTTLPFPSLAQGFDVDGNTAYVAAFDDGMYVVDVSNPTAPGIVGHLPRVGADIHGTAEVEGDVCLLGGSGISTQLHIVDVADPANPALITSYSYAGSQSLEDIAIDGNIAYYTGGTTGLHVIDITNPTLPTSLGSISGLGHLYGLVVDGNTAYVASRDDGLYSLDVSNPGGIGVLDFVPLPGSNSTGVARSGSYLFVSVEDEGLRMYDVTDPSAMTLMPYGSGGNATSPRGIAAAGRYVYNAVRFDGLDVMQVMADDFEVDDNVGRSLPVDGSTDDVFAARLTSQRSGDAAWRLSPDDGATWYGYPSEGEWITFAVPGSGLRWEAALGQNQPGVNPAIDQIQIDLGFAYPVVTDIADIDNDQGLQVRITWQFSGYDVAGSANPIYNYGVYRQISPTAGGVAWAEAVAAPDGIAATPAGWDFVTLVPATAESEYSAVVPTLADSSIAEGAHYSTFFVRALTASPATYYDSPPDSGYSVDNLEPAPPAGFLVAYNSGGNYLEWQPSEDDDFDYFRVYRSTDPNFTPGPETLAYATSGNSWNDLDGTGSYLYQVTAVDFAGNESDPATQQTVTGVDGSSTPMTFALGAAVPNPFNPSTVINYDVPAGGGAVEIAVYSVAGRRVRTLVSGTYPPGSHRAQWDGRDDRGARVSSGVYFYRMTAGGFHATRKMVLLK